MTFTLLLPTVAGLLGACVGSFLNVCIYRLPREGLFVGKPRRSLCPGCGSTIRAAHNIPILSWILLRGRCHDCQARISLRYPLVEALTAFLFVMATTLGDGSLSVPNLIGVFFWAAFFSSLVVITFIDIDHRIIPDTLSVNGACIVPWVAWFYSGAPIDAFPFTAAVSRLSTGWLSPGVLATTLFGVCGVAAGVFGMVLFRRHSAAWDGSKRTWWDTRLAGSASAAIGVAGLGAVGVARWTALESSQALLSSLLGMAVGAGSIYAIGILGRLVFRKDAMGFGDVKLMGFLGAALGAKSVLFAIFVACLLGTVIGIGIKLVTRSSYMPFGPFLCAGAVVMVLWSDAVDTALRWYMSVSQQLVQQVLNG